jgi:hypothetical protein
MVTSPGAGERILDRSGARGRTCTAEDERERDDEEQHARHDASDEGKVGGRRGRGREEGRAREITRDDYGKWLLEVVAPQAVREDLDGAQPGTMSRAGTSTCSTVLRRSAAAAPLGK